MPGIVMGASPSIGAVKLTGVEPADTDSGVEHPEQPSKLSVRLPLSP